MMSMHLFYEVISSILELAVLIQANYVFTRTFWIPPLYKLPTPLLLAHYRMPFQYLRRPEIFSPVCFFPEAVVLKICGH